MSAEPESADVFDFVDLYLQSIEHGDDQPLAYWLERFPRSQPAVAREWLSLRSPSQAGAQQEHGDVAPQDGVLRLGPYRVLHELGSGGQGTVYLAEDSRIARRVALKVLSTSFDSVSDEKRQRFRREADVIAKLEHPGLCTIHDADLAAQTPWIAMRYVEGKTLAELISDARAADGGEVFGLRFAPRNTLELSAILLLFERSARALHAAHEAGVVHRDVKPGNVLVALDGRPVLLDFGLARDDDSMIGTITQSGDIFGTPAYMSPEQLEMKSGALDRRTDVYSLGVALFEALTLTRPFDHVARTELYRQILQDPVPDARKKNTALPADVQVVLETALEKERDRRYPTALELAEDLRRIREYEPIHARPASVRVRFARWTRRHPALAVATIGTILALSIGLAITLKLLANERRAIRFAIGKHLAQRTEALASDDPPVALALGVEAVERAPNDLTRASLATALDACWMVRAVDPGSESRDLKNVSVSVIAASGSSDMGAAGFSYGAVQLIDLWTGDVIKNLVPHASEVVSIEFDPSGKRLLSAAHDGTVHLQSVITGNLVHKFELGWVCGGASFSPDARVVLVRMVDGRVRLFDAVTFLPLFDVGAEEPGTRSAAFSPDGTLLLLHAASGNPVVYDARSGERVCTLACDGRAVACEFVPRDPSARVIVASRDGSVRAFDGRTGRSRGESVRVDDIPTAVVASADGSHAILIADKEAAGWAWLCDLERGTVRRIDEHDGHCVTSAQFSPDGKRFATTSFDTSIRIFDTASARQERVLRVPFRQLDACWSADGERLISRPNSAFSHVWYARARPDAFELEGHTAPVKTACFAPDGKVAATASEDGTARLWKTPAGGDGRGVGAQVAVLQHEGPMLLAAFCADGSALLTASAGGDAGVFAAHDGAPLRPLARHPGALLGADIDARGERFVTLCVDGLARVWPARSDGPGIVLEAAPAELACAAFSDDGEVIVVGGKLDDVRVHDPIDGRLVRSLHIGSSEKSIGGVIDLAFRPWSRELAVGCGDNGLRFLDAVSGETTRWFEAEDKDKAEAGSNVRDSLGGLQFKSLAFSRDGRNVLVTTRFGFGAVRSIALEAQSSGGGRHVESGRSTKPRTMHSKDLTSASYDGPGSLVLTTSKDGSAYVWSAVDGTPIARREGFPSAVTCGSLSSAGGALRAITGRADGRVSVWPVDPLPAARARLPRPLAKWEKDRERQLALPLVLEFDE